MVFLLAVATAGVAAFPADGHAGVAFVAVGGAAPAPPNRADTVRLTGVVRADDGAPVEGANVFIVPGLEGDVTGPDGRFTVVTTRSDSVTLVARAAGLETIRLRVRAPATGLTLRLDRRPVETRGFRIEVSSPGPLVRPEASLTSLDVVRTPGATADPFRALQSESGVLAVDEGVGLHLQGGAASEVRVLLDGTAMVAPFRTSSASGVEFGSVGPFLLDDVSFSTAGFDVRVGDALSGVVRGRTRSPPEDDAGHVTATAAGASGRLDVELGGGLGARLTGGFSDLSALLDVHGREDDFVDAPRGADGSLSLGWTPKPGSRVKLFVLGRRDGFVSREDGGGPERFRWKSRDHHAVLSARSVRGPIFVSAAIASSGADRRRTFGTFRLREDEDRLEVRGSVAWSAAPELVLRSGGVVERRRATLRGRVVEVDGSGGGGADGSADDDRDGDGKSFDSRVRAVRMGGFVQVEAVPVGRLGLKGGVRADHFTLTDGTTVEPRIAALIELFDDVEVELAWGRYHQVPPLLAADSTVGVGRPASMAATHWTAALRAPGPGPVRRLRLRAYRKTYGSLVQEDRTHRFVAGGRGTATGVDLQTSAVVPGGVRIQAAVSLVDADRTDPNTGVVARSPFEASPSLAVQATRAWAVGVEVGLAYRHGRGVPFTPVVDARFDPERGGWIPDFGAPRSQRLPDLSRLDLSASWTRLLWDDGSMTFFAAVQNLFDRANVAEIRYTRNFSERVPVRSAFARTFFVGGTLSIPFRSRPLISASDFHGSTIREEKTAMTPSSVGFATYAAFVCALLTTTCGGGFTAGVAPPGPGASAAWDSLDGSNQEGGLRTHPSRPLQESAEEVADSLDRGITEAAYRGDLRRLDRLRILSERATGAYPDRPWFRYYRGYVFYRQGILAMSTGDEDRADDLLHEARTALARSIEVQQTADARALLSAVIGLRISLSPMIRGMTMGSAADRHMDDALELEPENPRVWLLHGIAAFNTPGAFGGGKEKARRRLERSLTLFEYDQPEPTAPSWGRAEGHAWLGRVHAEWGEPERARGAYREALHLAPEYGWVRRVLLPRLEGESSGG